MENENRRRRLNKLAEGEREKLIAGIKNQHLGLGSAGKRRRANKSRSDFDWDYYSDDTSFGDSIYLYQNPHCPFFGQRFRAGLDCTEHEKQQFSSAQKNDGGAVETSDDDTSWTDFTRDFNISYRGSRVTKPMRNWAETGLSRQLLHAVVDRAGYSSPTPIQMAVIPLGLRRRDYVCLSNTGSGKTATFVLPMLFYISKLPLLRHGKKCADQGPNGLVLAPTIERVQHVENEVLKFAPLLGIKVISLTGGPELRFKASQGCEVLITTPGSLLYCLEEGDIVLHQCDYVVLDKADHMIGICYGEELVSILDAMGLGDFTSENEIEVVEINKDEDIYPTTCIFSATMEPAVERLAMKYLRNPVVVTVGNPGKATDLITQNVIMMEESEKLCRLPKLLEEHGDKKTIVFVNTPISAILLYEIIMKAGYEAEILYGSSQEFTVRNFIVLVATDVDVRGLDTYDVAHVINYDMPGHIDTYMRRLERAGRWGETGLVTTFLTLNDTEVFYDLKQTLIQSNSYVPPELDRHKASNCQPVKKPQSHYDD